MSQVLVATDDINNNKGRVGKDDDLEIEEESASVPRSFVTPDECGKNFSLFSRAR